MPVRRTVDPGMLCRAAAGARIDSLWKQEGLPVGGPVYGIGPHHFINRNGYSDGRYAFQIEYEEYSDSELDSYYDSMASVADVLAERGPVIFFSLSTRMPPGDDREACAWIVSRMKRQERAHIIRGEYSAAELMGLLSRLDIYISTRLHGYALAIGAGVPTIAVEFHPKMRGLAQELDIEDWVVPLRGIKGEQVSSISESILGALSASRARVQRNFRAATLRATNQITAALPPRR
jgi:hypothetical protein